jgi:tape measure domain-containing protein
MATTLSALGLVIDSTDALGAADALDKFADKAHKAGKAAEDLEDKAEDAGDELEELDKSGSKVNGMLAKFATVAGSAVGRLVAMVAAAASVRGYYRMADAWSDMQSRVGAAVKDMAAAPALMERMVSLANASYSPLSQTVEVYARNVGVLKALGYSANETADYTEALNHALVITATKGERAASVQNALSKAMALGKLQADGLESVLANGGRVAEALAAELNTNVNGLRNLASQGKITSAVIAGALLKSLEDLRQEAAAMPATVADGMERIRTGITFVIGVFDQLTNSSGTLAGVLVGIGDALATTAMWIKENGETIAFIFDSVVGTAVVAATALISQLMYSWVAAMTASVVATGTLTGALIVLRSALLTTGIGALVVLAGVLVGQFFKLIAAAGGFGEAMKLVGAVGVEVWDRILQGGAALNYGMNAVFEGIKAGWFTILADMQAAWAGFLSAVAGGMSAIGADEIAAKLGNASISAGSADYALRSKAGIANENSKGSFGNAEWLIQDAMRPLESLTELRDVLGETQDAVDGVAVAGTEALSSLEKLGGGGKAAADKTKEAFEALKAATETFKGTLASAFTGLVTGATSLRDAVGNVIAKLAEMTAMRGFEMLWSGGLGKASGGFLKSLLGFADGAAFMGGQVTAFANGGVVSSPTTFPMRSGVGLMGEAGPEAIMPLTRGPDGRLGVTSARETAAPAQIDINIRNEVGTVVEIARNEAQAQIRVAAPTIVSKAVQATGQAMRSTKTFGSA